METIIGSMDSAYFVPRHQILSWINRILLTNIIHIQDLGSGAIYCQLLDASFGQKVPMNKINWKAKFQYQFIANLKIFKDCLDKLSINKHIQIEKLAKAKYQDNLTIIQWLKKYIELHGSISSDYNPLLRRNHAILESIAETKRNLTPILRNNKNTINQCLTNVSITQNNQSEVYLQTTPNASNKKINNKLTPNIDKKNTEEKNKIEGQLNNIKESNEKNSLKISLQFSQNKRQNDKEQKTNIIQLKASQKKQNTSQKKQYLKNKILQQKSNIKSFNQAKKYKYTLDEICEILISQAKPEKKIQQIEALVLGFKRSESHTTPFLDQE